MLADARRRAAEALADDEASIDRLQAAPASYLLTHEPDELARQARLIEPLPPRGTMRVAVSPEGTPDHWIVDVACRDTDGLLARLAARADRRRLRHRRGHRRHVAGRRGGRHVPRPRRRAPERSCGWPGDGALARRAAATSSR